MHRKEGGGGRYGEGESLGKKESHSHTHTHIARDRQEKKNKGGKKKKSLFILAVYSCAPDKRHMMLTKAYILADACSASSQLTSH